MTDYLNDPSASNFLATLANNQAPVAPAQVAPSVPPQRVSFLDSLRQIGEGLMMAGGPVGQEMLYNRQNQAMNMQKAQLGLEDRQTAQNDAATERMMQAVPALEQAYQQGGAPAAQQAWRQLAPLLNVAPEKAAQFNSMLTSDPEGTIKQMKAMLPQKNTGSLPSEIATYEYRNKLPETERAAFDAHIAQGKPMSAYQAAQIELGQGRLGATREGIRSRTATQLAAIAQRREALRTKLAAGGISGKGADAALKMPVSQQNNYLSNNDSMRQIDATKSLVENRKESVGLRFAVPEAVAQRMDREGVAARAAVANIGSLLIHDRSGATVTVAESPRLRPFIPSVTDTPEAVGRKLDRLRTILAENNADIEKFYRRSPGGAPASPRSPAAPRAAGGNQRTFTVEQARSLPSGTRFMGTDGRMHVKH